MYTGKHQKEGQKGKKFPRQYLPDSWKGIYSAEKQSLLIPDMHLGHEVIQCFSILRRVKCLFADVHKNELFLIVFVFIVFNLSRTDTAGTVKKNRYWRGSFLHGFFLLRNYLFYLNHFTFLPLPPSERSESSSGKGCRRVWHNRYSR